MDAKVVTAPTELLPCPFCGAAAERREYDHRHPYEPFGLVAAHLEDCFLNLLRDEEAMCTAWDTRPIEDDLAASRDRASDACATVQRERDEAREMLGARIEALRSGTIEDEARVDERIRAFLARYEASK